VSTDEHAEEVQLPEMVEPQKVLVMFPRDPQTRPVAMPKATNVAGSMPGQPPGELPDKLHSLGGRGLHSMS